MLLFKYVQIYIMRSGPGKYIEYMQRIMASKTDREP